MNQAAWLAVAFVGVGCLAGCEQRNQFQPPPPPQVQVSRPVQQAISDTIDFSGTTVAFARVEIRTRVQGYLEQVLFQDGADVEKGDLLFVIEQGPFKAALKSAEADVQKAVANLHLAETNLRRSTQLSKNQAISQSQLDLDQANVETAKADLAAANAALETAQLNLSYTEIRAPISGRIGRHLLDTGNLVHAEETMLAVIETIDPIYTHFFVSESDLLMFMEMLRMHEIPDPSVEVPTLYMGLEGEQGFPHVGKLDFRELGIDPGTGTTLRRAIFENPGEQIVPGLFVRLRALIGAPQPRLMVEERAIGTDQRGDYLLVVGPDNKVEKRIIELGPAAGNMRVIREGIASNDRVVINALQRARPGSEVSPQETEMTVQIPSSYRGMVQPGSTQDESMADVPADEEPPAEVADSSDTASLAHPH